jgi:hypothetical protein
MRHDMDYEECTGCGNEDYVVIHDVYRSCTIVVHEISDYYTSRTFKEIDRYWTRLVKGILEVEI